MEKSKITNTTSKGQHLVIVALSMFVLVAMSALLLDGGFAYMDRRKAQVAADAGALAGAWEMCLGGGPSLAPATAINYATQHNEADAATAIIVDDEIIVNTTLAHPSFFAQIFGIPQVDVSAVAAAACFTPGSASVLPIAWNCRPPVEGFGSPSDDCEIKSLDWETEFEPLITGPDPVTINGTEYLTPFNFDENMLPEIYIVMDSKSTIDDVATQCYDEINNPSGELQCDLDGDGEIDILGNGDRSWLDLDGGNAGGSKELDKWITDGFRGSISIHTWVPDNPGTKASTFFSVNGRKGDVLMLPVFNAYCVNDPLVDPNCETAAHLNFPPAPTPTPLPGTDNANYASGSSTYFHIVGFANFYIACVDQPSLGNCPGNNAAVAAGVLDANEKTLEGYFIEGYPVDTTSVGSGGVDLGVYIYSLTH